MNSELLKPCNPNCDFCYLNYSNTISNIPIFKDIGEQEIKIIIRDTHHQVRTYSKGDVILQAGDNCSYLYILVKGEVSAEMIDLSGKILKIENIIAPNTIATAFLFGNKASCPVTVTANDDVKLMLFPKDELLNLFQKNKQILTNYLAIVADRAFFLSHKLQFMSFKTIKAKLAHYLLNLAGEHNTFKLDKTQQQLANFFGVERPSIARVIGELTKDEIIATEKKEIKILNRIALEDLTE